MSLENKYSENNSSQEKNSHENKLNGLSGHKLKQALEKMSHKKRILALATMTTLAAFASNPTKAQSVEKQTYNVTMPDGSHKQLTQRELFTEAIKNNESVIVNGKKMDPKVALENLDNYEKTHQTINYPNNNPQHTQERRSKIDTSIERGANKVDQTMDQFGDAFILLSFNHQNQKQFGSYSEMESFMAQHGNSFDPSRIIISKNGRTTRLTDLEYFKNNQQEIINNYINSYRRNTVPNNSPNNQNQINQNPNNPNGPQNNQENQEGNQENQNTINYNFYFQRIPMGKGEILNYNDDGTATMFKSSKSYKKIVLKKISNDGGVLPGRYKNSPIDLSKLFNSIPQGKGQVIQDNGNGTATVYETFKNKRGEEVTLTLARMIRVF